ncbi:MAG: hypothetical protein JW808_06970 [Victivallales bacterium]|nr:hypothetical protein [Victivallales bacterium]
MSTSAPPIEQRPTSAEFTLVEVLLAAGILLLVFTIAGTVLFSVQQTWTRSQERSEKLRRLITVDRIVNSAFPNIIPFEWRDERLRTRNIFFGRADRLIFATTHRVNITEEGALRFIKLHLDGENLVASYRNTPILFWDESVNTTDDEVIATGVQSLSFVYADFDANRSLIWESDWDEEQRRNIPVAIQMTISWEDGTSSSWLRRTAGSAKREQFGRRIQDRARQ